MWIHKLRTSLAVFGIAWGTLTVILLLALSQGFHDASKRNIMQIADGAFFAIASTTDSNYRGFLKGRPIRMKAATIMALQKTIPSLRQVSPILIKENNIGFKKNQTALRVFGVSSSFNRIRKFYLIPQSRFITSIDIQNKKQICILGNKIAKRLFGENLSVPQTVRINDVPFMVVGIIESSQKSIHNYYENNALIPYSTFIKLWGDQTSPFFVAKPTETANISHVERDIRRYFSQKFQFSPKDKTALRIFNTTKIYRFFKWFFIGIQLFLGTCGTLTLGIGSLGVANIMFLTITERTREFGIRMAIGATTWHILFQVLLEALLITSLGGLFGYLIASSTVHALQFITLPEWLGKPIISLFSLFITITILTGFGMLAGFFPARRATKLDPVDALRGIT
jgi:putative ABC transport system permease protein